MDLEFEFRTWDAALNQHVLGGRVHIRNVKEDYPNLHDQIITKIVEGIEDGTIHLGVKP